MNTEKAKLKPRKVFWKCGACSHAMFHLLNHEYDNHRENEEKASDLLAGGIAMKGKQCGMLWGASLAVGTESFHRYIDKNVAAEAAINASKQIVESFSKRTGSVNCRDIVKVDWENKRDMSWYMIKIILHGFVYSECFNLIVKWTPEAIEAAEKGMSEKTLATKPCISCASEVVNKMGGNEEESMMVAGFAGGIGLSGNACGALSAAIWYKMLDWVKRNAGKKPEMMKNQDAKNILKIFFDETGTEMLCSKISGKQFSTVDEHSEFISSGGCGKLIDALAKA